MKHYMIYMLMLASALVISCENPDLAPDDNQEQTENENGNNTPPQDEDDTPSQGEGEGETEKIGALLP